MMVVETKVTNNSLLQCMKELSIYINDMIDKAVTMLIILEI